MPLWPSSPLPSHLCPQPTWYGWRACNLTPEGLTLWYTCSFSSHAPLRCEMPQAHTYSVHEFIPAMLCQALPFSPAPLAPMLETKVGWGGPAKSQYSSKAKSGRTEPGWWLITAQGNLVPRPSFKRALLRAFLSFACYSLHRYYKANGVRMPHFQKVMFYFIANWMRWIPTIYACITIHPQMILLFLGYKCSCGSLQSINWRASCQSITTLLQQKSKPLQKCQPPFTVTQRNDRQSFVEFLLPNANTINSKK